MIPEIAGSITALKGAIDIAKGILASTVDAEMKPKIMELNQAIIGAQLQLMSVNDSYSEAQSKIKELEAELAKLNNWEQEKQRYQLLELVPGTFIYRVKPEMQGSEPEHDICPNCYQEGVKSILQANPKGDFFSVSHVFCCPKCKVEYIGE